MKARHCTLLLLCTATMAYSQGAVLKLESIGTYSVDQSMRTEKLSSSSFDQFRTIGNAGIFFGDGSSACIYINLDTGRARNIPCYTIDSIKTFDSGTQRLTGVTLLDWRDWYTEPYETVISDPEYTAKEMTGRLRLVFSAYKPETFAAERLHDFQKGRYQIALYGKQVTIDVSSVNSGDSYGRLIIVFDKTKMIYYVCVNVFET